LLHVPLLCGPTQSLYEQAKESRSLKATLTAMKESELELAAQDAADNARHVELLVGLG
jgi:hypothetical protein